MKAVWFNTAAAAVGAMSIAVGAQAPSLRITSPAAETLVSGPTRREAVVEPPDVAGAVESVTFFVNGRIVCTAQHPPFGCGWDPGEVVRGHHLRVVATFSDGRPRLIGNLHTKDLGFADQVRTDAVLVPVIVTEHGNFVRGLKLQDFELFEDNVKQTIASLASEDAPLDLVLAIDVSGSMENALGEVKAAVKQLLSKLRPGDAATLLGFNDIMFKVAEREKDPGVRERAVDLLSSWGGTALYDATVRVLEFVSRDWGRKGVVIFSDGEDRNSLTTRDAAMARVQASSAMLYTVGFGAGATEPRLRSSLESYARATGGRPFFPRHVKELDAVFDEIVADLSNQYVLSYSSTNLKQDQKWRSIKVRVRKGNYAIRARERYQFTPTRPAGR
jgi:Ca-activated chloride channel family protein